MEILRHYEHVPSVRRGGVAALGNFDGFHRGHQTVVGEAGRIATREHIPLAVVVTEPHPRAFFNPAGEAFRLTGFRERAKLLEAFGVHLMWALPFTKEFSTLSPERFVREILAKGLGLRHVVVGHDYRFGQGRAGDASVLATLAQQHDIAVRVVAPVSIAGQQGRGAPYSSTLVRELLKQGAARAAATMLGHWWTVNGNIDLGERRGRRIGFPTCNIIFSDTLVPRYGVYAVRAHLEGVADRLFEGVANVGVRPTFGRDNAVLLEVHLFDCQGDHYGRHIQVHFVDWIRPEVKFSSGEALKAQIVKDCEAAHLALATSTNAHSALPTPTLAAYLSAHTAPSHA